MATFRIPNNQGQVRQLNQGDVFGELWATKNIDLSTSPGKIKLATPTTEVASQTDLSTDWAAAITKFSGDIHVLTDNNLYSVNETTGAVSLKDNGPNGAVDMTVFDGKLLITSDTDVDTWDGTTYTSSWWTSTKGLTALTSGVPHVAITSTEGQEILAITDGNKLQYYNKSTDAKTELVMLTNHIGCSQTSGIDGGWVGTYAEDGGYAYVYRWNTGQDQFTEKYEVNATAVLAMQTVNNVPYLITERGELQQFNGAGFTTIATLPIFNEPLFLNGVETGLIQDTDTLRPVHPKGMQRFGDNLLIFINTDSAVDSKQPVNERSPSGVWEVNTRTGSMWHRFSPNNESYLTRSGPLFVLNDENGRVYFGAERQPVNTEADRGVWREDLSGTTNYGYAITTELHSESFLDTFSSVNIASLHDSTDKIVVKYREGKSLDLPVYADITWVANDTFTTTADLSAVKTHFDSLNTGEKGYEVEVLVDAGAGRCAHITAMDASASTYTVTVDTAIGIATDVARVCINNWLLLDEYDTTESIKRIAMNQLSPHIQVKLYMEGDSGYPEISRVVVKSDNKHPLK